ncbi:MAG: hypothetical protein R6U96_09970 [Promethearchaeia archaeon]
MVSVRKVLLIPFFLGIGLVGEALIFRFFLISPYRDFIGTSEGIVRFNHSVIILIFLKGFFWLGITLIATTIFLYLMFSLNPERVLDLASNKNKPFILILLTLIIIVTYLVIYPPFWVLGIISTLILSILLWSQTNIFKTGKNRVKSLTEKVITTISKKKVYSYSFYGFIGFIFFYLLVPLPIQPSNLPNHAGENYIQNGRVYDKQNNQEVRLMGWDYHWVHFHGPGEAWDDSAEMERFDLETIRQDLIWASQAGNFIRICANWFEIEQEKGVYNYSTLDAVFNLIENDPEINDLHVLLEIGPIKTSKIWVQASLPKWFPYRIDLQDPHFLERIKPFLNKTIERYKDKDSLFAYQLENEPDFLVTTVTDNDEDYVITGDVNQYLTRLNNFVKERDSNHFTSINLLVNNLYQQKKLPPVDIIFYDYYGSIENTAPLQDYARKYSQYITGNTGFGVAELQLNNWHYEITPEIIEEEYQSCIESGMTMILWSELHDPVWWDGSAISPDNMRTEKYYKVQELYQKFQNEEINSSLLVQASFDWLNVLIFFSVISAMIFVYYTGEVVLNKRNRKYEEENYLNLINPTLCFIIIPSLVIIFPYISNILLVGIGISLLNLVFSPIIMSNIFHNRFKRMKYKKIKALILAVSASIPTVLLGIIGFY